LLCWRGNGDSDNDPARLGHQHVATSMIAFLCFLLITLIFLQSPFLQKALGAIIWILILAYLFGAAE
jgi:hypothetical protein